MAQSLSLPLCRLLAEIICLEAIAYNVLICYLKHRVIKQFTADWQFRENTFFLAPFDKGGYRGFLIVE